MKHLVKLLIAAGLASAICACDATSIDAGDSPGPALELEHGMMVLGRQLEDPYSVKNITKALQSLYPTKADEINVSATDLYVRFLPGSQEEYDKLVEMGVEMLDHPVDYEIVREGDYYHDPEIPEGDITWQYAVVSPDFRFPADIPFEVLDKCHITEHEVFTRSGEEWIDWEAVESSYYHKRGTHVDYSYSTGKSGVYAELPLLNYKGYRAWDENGDPLEVLTGEKGRLKVYLNADGAPHEIHTAYKVSVFFSLLYAFSVFCMAAVIISVRKDR